MYSKYRKKQKNLIKILIFRCLSKATDKKSWIVLKYTEPRYPLQWIWNIFEKFWLESESPDVFLPVS